MAVNSWVNKAIGKDGSGGLDVGVRDARSYHCICLRKWQY